MNSHNTFAGAFVDRHGHRRQDPDWLRSMLQDQRSIFVPVWGNRCLADGDPLRTTLLSHADVARYMADDETIFLGMFRERPAFAIHIEREEPQPFRDSGEFHDLRYLGNELPADESNLVAHARALVIWHGMQKYCGKCGAPACMVSGGNSRICINEGCATTLFPRVDPAIIVLVSNGRQCLLGRQASWPEGRYSTIAGFVEPGESLEDSVRREVHEETNIAVHHVRYHSSQPWPFPSSLMLGFTAQATTDDIELNDGELDDAKWFTRKELRSGYPKLPYRLSIARRLVDHWLFADGN